MAAATQLGGQFVPLDVTDDASTAAALGAIAEREGHLDVLVNNAGISTTADVTGPVALEVFDTNAVGVVRVTQAALPLLEASENPVVVNVSSALGSFWAVTNPERRQFHFPSIVYGASKAAVSMLTVQYARRRIRGSSSMPSSPASPRPSSPPSAAPVSPSKRVLQSLCAWPRSARTAPPGRSRRVTANSAGDRAASQRLPPRVRGKWSASAPCSQCRHRPRLTLLTEAERVASWIGVHDEDVVWFLHRAAQDDRTELGSPESGRTEVGNGQVEMELLRRTVRPFRRGIRRCTLEGELARRITDVHFAPLRVTEIGLAVQEVGVEGRKS